MARACLVLLAVGWIGSSVRAQEAESAPPVEPPASGTTQEEPAAEEPAATERVSLDAALASLDPLIPGLEKIAIPRPEVTGTAEDLSGLEAVLVEKLSGFEGVAVVAPAEVFKKVGPEFAISPEGIAGVSRKLGASAALFVQVFKSPDTLDLHLLLVDAGAKVVLDRVFHLDALPPGISPAPEEPIAGAEPADAPAAHPRPLPPREEAARPEQDARMQVFEQRSVALAPRHRVVGGASIGLAGRHVAVGIHSPGMVATDWMIVEGGQPISEMRLAEIAGRTDIVERIQDEVGSMKTLRNVGIGMTLGGFVAAGAAFPFVKADEGGEVTAAGVLVGTGLAVGAAGVVLWLIYGPKVATATSPYPATHMVSRDEAEDMIDSYNDRLRRELDVEPPSPPAASRPGDASGGVRFSLVPDPRGGGAAALTFSF